MRRHRGPSAATLLLIALVTLAGCSSHKSAEPSNTSGTSAAAAAPTSTAPVQIGISPDGVTTSLSAPASSTEEEYYEACHWARIWMTERGGDPHAQIDAYLAMIQASQTGEKGSWDIPWAQLSVERQAGIIVAATAAADAGCD